jgi:hypothetical protein
MVASMPRKPRPKSEPKQNWDDPEESKRFLLTATEAEASDDPKDFEKALAKVISGSDRSRSSS